ncbi:SMI1/KNR4 family protein [Streptomyces sp. NBC_01016]|uniref:SMI1/KNR4 family protein n=1 Tax=Streptomyces sp. NBC_01016 TaxID=2903720 RepID=UPI00224F163D|nr:SMI1/KNR4 family protein [Streptomyces sp. NBC_01016]MCX4829665.1 SMI1/KNR4 family protein [Streptomyces sp. NBC_01016]
MNTEHADPAELAALRAAFAATNSASALGWDAVRAFEAEHGVLLPEPYRTFVAEIADGSPLGPPKEGLLSLGAMSERTEPGLLARPFPLTEEWLGEWDDGVDSDDELYWERLDDITFDGSLYLGTEGCGMDWHLIVSGTHRGAVWMLDGESAIPFGGERGQMPGPSGFAGWVTHWAADRPWFPDLEEVVDL